MATSIVPMSDHEPKPHLGSLFPEFFNALSREFRPQDVRILKKGGRDFRYVTARTVANRLDAVCGPEGWWDRYKVLSPESVLCRLTLVLPDGSRVTKCDAGGVAGMQDPGDDDKSAFSDALKRAAAKFGVGRYLWGDGVPTHHGDEPPMGSLPGDPPEKTYRRPNGGSPKADQQYLRWAIGYVRRVNDHWHAKHLGQGLKDLLREGQLTGHLYLTCVEDAARNDGVTNNHRLRHVANTYAAGAERVEAEAQEYVRHLAEEAEAALEPRAREPGED